MELFSSSGEGADLPAESGRIPTPQTLFEAAETIFHRIRAPTDPKISRGAFGGQHFGVGCWKVSPTNARKPGFIAPETRAACAVRASRWVVSGPVASTASR